MPKKNDVIEPIQDSFDAVVDAVAPSLSAPTYGAAKAIAGAQDSPLRIGEAEIACYVLEDETRVIHQKGMVKSLGFSRGGARSQAEAEIVGAELPRFATLNWISPFINKELSSALSSPILFVRPEGGTAYGYPAEILTDICDAILEADKQGATGDRQKPIVERATQLMRAWAKVGINALVDEVTGYQRSRKSDALRLLLEKYIAEGLQRWIHTFPDSFFSELDRLYDNAPTTSRSRPQYYGKFINKYVYDPIEHGYVKSELNKLNIADDGTRKAKFHQWLTDAGRTVLTRQIGKVEGIMEMCDDIEHFKRVARRQKTISVAPYLFDEMNRIID